MHLTLEPAQLCIELSELFVTVLQRDHLFLEGVILFHQVLSHLGKLLNFVLHLTQFLRKKLNLPVLVLNLVGASHDLLLVFAALICQLRDAHMGLAVL